MLSQKTRYSIRALQHLADTWRQGPVRLDAIAEAQNIPREFLTVILAEMVRGELMLTLRDEMAAMLDRVGLIDLIVLQPSFEGVEV